MVLPTLFCKTHQVAFNDMQHDPSVACVVSDGIIKYIWTGSKLEPLDEVQMVAYEVGVVGGRLDSLTKLTNLIMETLLEKGILTPEALEQFEDEMLLDLTKKGMDLDKIAKEFEEEEGNE